MIVSELDYKRHFTEFAKRIFTLHPNATIPTLRQKDASLLRQYGLPDFGVPFFKFDLSIGYLRDIDIPNCLFVLGTVTEVSSDEYIYIAKDHTIRICDAQSNDYFVNSSLEQLMTNIYIYSSWLEEMEKRCKVIERNIVKEEDVFEIYYMLRAEDHICTENGAFWKEIIQMEPHYDESFSEVL